MSSQALAAYRCWKSQVERHEAFFSNTPKDALTLTICELREEALKPLFEKLETALIECEPEDVNEADHADLTNRYFKTLGFIRDQIKSKSATIIENEIEDYFDLEEIVLLPKLEFPFVSRNSGDGRKNERCLMCGASHGLWMCQKFDQMKNADRWEFVKRNRLCFICLEKGHEAQGCQKKYLRCNSCSGCHGSLLHDVEDVEVPLIGTELTKLTMDMQSPMIEARLYNRNIESGTFTPFSMTKDVLDGESTQDLMASEKLKKMKTEFSVLSDGIKRGLPCEENWIEADLKRNKSADSLVNEEIVKESRLNKEVKLSKGPQLQESKFGMIVGRETMKGSLSSSSLMSSLSCVVTPKVTGLMLNEKLKVPTRLETKFGMIVGREILKGSLSSSSLESSCYRVVKPEAIEIEEKEKLERFLAAAVEFDVATATEEESFCGESFVETTNAGTDGTLIVDLPMKSNIHQLEKNIAKVKRGLAWKETDDEQKKKIVKQSGIKMDQIGNSQGSLMEAKSRDVQEQFEWIKLCRTRTLDVMLWNDSTVDVSLRSIMRISISWKFKKKRKDSYVLWSRRRVFDEKQRQFCKDEEIEETPRKILNA